MRKARLIFLVGLLSILSFGCSDSSKDWSDVVVDYEKARNDLQRQQAYFVPNTSFQLRFNLLTPNAFVE